MKAPKLDSIMWHKQIIFLTSSDCNTSKHLIQNCVTKQYADLVTDESNRTISTDTCWPSYCRTFGNTNNHHVTYSGLARQKWNCSELLTRNLPEPKDNIIHKTILLLFNGHYNSSKYNSLITTERDPSDNWCCFITCHLRHATAAT
jgi:hypothetical protein